MQTESWSQVSDLIHEIAKLREAYFDQRCRALGVTTAQWWLMYKLCGYIQDTPNQTELAQRIGIGSAAVGEILSKVERAGYVRREEDPANKRAKRVAIMEPGRELVAAMHDVSGDYADTMPVGLSEHDRVILCQLLTRIGENIRTLLAQG